MKSDFIVIWMRDVITLNVKATEEKRFTRSRLAKVCVRVPNTPLCCDDIKKKNLLVLISAYSLLITLNRFSLVFENQLDFMYVRFPRREEINVLYLIFKTKSRFLKTSNHSELRWCFTVDVMWPNMTRVAICTRVLIYTMYIRHIAIPLTLVLFCF